MAAEVPLSRLVLAATSVTDDLSFVALADVSRAIGEDATDYRVIGGHMVTVLAARWKLGANLYRETGDADLGVPPLVARNDQFPGQLKALGYDQVGGNRFARIVSDIPITVTGAESPPQMAIIDVLIPAYTSRARQSVKVSEDLVTTEVPGLAVALARPPVTMTLELQRLNGQMLSANLLFPDELSALVLKSLATQVRNRPTDMTDIWRCLEIAFAAGVVPSDFDRSTHVEAARIIRDLFASHDSAGMIALADEQSLSGQAADQRSTRVQALIARVVGTR
jgi:hypothetical protein